MAKQTSNSTAGNATKGNSSGGSTTTKGQSISRPSNGPVKGSGYSDHYNDDYGGSSSSETPSKGHSTYDDNEHYDGNSIKRNSTNEDTYTNDGFSGNTKGETGSFDSAYNHRRDDSSYGNSKENPQYSNGDVSDAPVEGNTTSYNDKYGNTNQTDYSDSGNESRYGKNEPINDPPPYDDHNDEILVKRPNEDSNQNAAKISHDETEAHDYAQRRDVPNNQTANTIDRVWLWCGGVVPNLAIQNPNADWWSDRAALGMTDYVISLNDHDFSSGLGIKSNYFARGNRPERWRPICEVLRISDSLGISPHLMIFLQPNANMIREAAQVLQEIIQDSTVVPRSIHLDLEGWWTGRGQIERRNGELAIQQYFYDEWQGRKPEMGIGVTCIGSVPAAIHGALSQVDFAIPQMYASERNYGRPIRSNTVQQHFTRAVEALGPQGKVVIGQTSNGRHVDSNVMKEMIGAVLNLNHENHGTPTEIVFWSDIHLLNSRTNKAFFLRLTNAVKQNGLSIEDLNSI
ncbi:MAG: hypothetical protein WA913_03180 [Pricia sp.]